MAPGIDAVWTERHGGLKLSPERADEVDPAWREPAGWYEQDCAWAKAVLTHHRDMKPKDVENAHKAAAKYYPEYARSSARILASNGLPAPHEP
jgi:hypothetical protein